MTFPQVDEKALERAWQRRHDGPFPLAEEVYRPIFEAGWYSLLAAQQELLERQAAQELERHEADQNAYHEGLNG